MARSSIGRILILGIAAACTSLAAERPAAAIQVAPVEQPEAAQAAGKIPEVIDAAERFRQGDVDGALALLTKAVKEHSELPPARVIMAQFFSGANRPAGVRASLEQAVIEAPDDPEAYVVLGNFALREGRWTEADLLYAKATDLAAVFDANADRKKALLTHGYSGLASIAEVRQDWQTAQKHLDALLTLDRNNANALQRLARALFQQGKPDEAMEQLQAAAKIDDNVLSPQAVLARFYEQAGDRENAAKYMEQALESQPQDLKTRLAAAQWALDTEQLDLAAEHADAAAELDPSSLEAKLLRGVVAVFRKNYQTAVADFENVLLQSPGNFAASNNLALVLCEQDDEAKQRRALEHAQVNARQYPKHAEAASTLGWVLYRLGRIDEAERALQDAAALSGGNLTANAAYYLARVALRRGRSSDAAQLLDRALKTKQPFYKREEAESLLEELNK